MFLMWQRTTFTTAVPSQRHRVPQLQNKCHYSVQCCHDLLTDITIPLESDVIDYYSVASALLVLSKL